MVKLTRSRIEEGEHRRGRCPEAFTLPSKGGRASEFLEIEGRLGHTLIWLWQPRDVVAP